MTLASHCKRFIRDILSKLDEIRSVYYANSKTFKTLNRYLFFYPRMLRPCASGYKFISRGLFPIKTSRLTVLCTRKKVVFNQYATGTCGLKHMEDQGHQKAIGPVLGWMVPCQSAWWDVRAGQNAINNPFQRDRVRRGFRFTAHGTSGCLGPSWRYISRFREMVRLSWYCLGC